MPEGPFPQSLRPMNLGSSRMKPVLHSPTRKIRLKLASVFSFGGGINLPESRFKS